MLCDNNVPRDHAAARGRKGLSRGRVSLAVLIVVGLILFASSGCTKVSRRPEPSPVPRTATPVDYTPLQKQVSDYLTGKEGTYGVFFKDLSTGQIFGINETLPIPAASTVKVPIVLYVNNLVAEGRLDWNEKITYSVEKDWRPGAGILQMEAIDGDRLSIRILSNLAITISDNVATAMLIRRLGLPQISEFMRSIGGKTVYPNGENITTAVDMGTYVQAVLDFAGKRPDLGGRLLDDMAHPIYDVGIPGELPPNILVPHKEGDLPDMAGDIGVVYAARPYIIVVLARDASNPDEVFVNIARVSKIVYDFQQRL